MRRISALLIIAAVALTGCGDKQTLPDETSEETDMESFVTQETPSVEYVSNASTYDSFESPEKKTGDRVVITINDVEFSFRWCPAGTFIMGSPKKEAGKEDDPPLEKLEKQHEVKLTKGFWMMETEVTVGMFKAFVDETGYASTGFPVFVFSIDHHVVDSSRSWSDPGFNQDDNHPVTCVSWHDASEFCKWLSQKTGQNIHLPTEAQWEYACRAGSKTAYFWGNALNGDKANCDGNYPCGTSIKGAFLSKTTQVRSYQYNAWGLYDMHGNVGEWCQDWIADYPSESVTDPSGYEIGALRAVRGGCWSSYARGCRSAFRVGFNPNIRSNNQGFRVVAQDK